MAAALTETRFRWLLVLACLIVIGWIVVAATGLMAREPLGPQQVTHPVTLSNGSRAELVWGLPDSELWAQERFNTVIDLAVDDLPDADLVRVRSCQQSLEFFMHFAAKAQSLGERGPVMPEIYDRRNRWLSESLSRCHGLMPDVAGTVTRLGKLYAPVE